MTITYRGQTYVVETEIDLRLLLAKLFLQKAMAS